MKSLNGDLLAKIAACRTMLGISEEELEALKEPVKTIGNFLREIVQLKNEVRRLENALGYKPRKVLPNCLSCGTGRMHGSVDGFTCGEIFCRDKAIDIVAETRPMRNGNNHAQNKTHIVEI